MQNFDSCYSRGYYTTFSRRASNNVHISNKKLGHFKRMSWTMYTHDSFNLRWTFSIFKKVFGCGYFDKTWQAWLRLKKAIFYSRNYWGNVSCGSPCGTHTKSTVRKIQLYFSAVNRAEQSDFAFIYKLKSIQNQWKHSYVV